MPSLKGIPKCLSPELLHALSSMGHGDEILLADVHYPSASHARASTCGTIEIRADGCPSLVHLLESIMKFFPLDTHVESPVTVLEVAECDKSKNVDLSIWKDYQKILDSAEGKPVKMEVISRERFYERAKNTYAIVLSGDDTIYANIILKKGIARG